MDKKYPYTKPLTLNSAGDAIIAAPLRFMRIGTIIENGAAILYPQTEVERAALKWDGLPIVYGCHNDGPAIGIIRHPYVHDGWTKGTGLFNYDAVKAANPDILQRLLAKQPIGLSEAMRCRKVEPTRNINYRGQYFTHIAANIEPIHIALLPDDSGHITINQGQGVYISEPRRAGRKF